MSLVFIFTDFIEILFDFSNKPNPYVQSPNCFGHTARTGLHFIRKLCTKQSWFDVCRQRITKKVSQWANLFRQLSWFLLLVLYLKSYILLCVDYCDVVWDSYSKQDSNPLQTLFNCLHCLTLFPPFLFCLVERSWPVFSSLS